MVRPLKLDEIRNPNCDLCPLHLEAEHVCLMGSGPTNAKIMIIGEAPGAREDDENRAFVGPAGKLLDSSLERLAELKRDDIYVTNVAKCRPPKNRTPEPGEIKVCVSEYLEEEFDLVKPDFVLLLGNSGLKGVLGKSGITKQHGIVVRKEIAPGHTAKIMATLHPAAVLRNPKWAQAYGMDMQRFGRMVRGELTSPKTEARIVRTKSQLKWLRRKLSEADVISWDIETYTFKVDPPYVRTNFQEWWDDDSQIASIAFTWEEGQSATVPLYHIASPWARDLDMSVMTSEVVPELASRVAAILRFLKPVLTRPDAKYVAHNGKFDARWMAAKGVTMRQTFDTMLAAHMLDENRPKGLKPLSRTILGADAYDVGEELGNAVEMPLKRLCVYNGKDTDYTYRLYRKFRPMLVEEERIARVFLKLMMPASEALVDIERHGVWIDPERWQDRHDKSVVNKDKLYDYINRWVPADMRPINLNSPQQVGRFLFDHLGLPIIETTAKGAPSSKESVLLRLAKEHKATTAMIKYRKWAKYLSTYLLPLWFEHRDQHGRVHSNYKLFGTVTGRLSGEGGIQQIPRDPFIRAILGGTPGWSFVQGDFSQVELRIAAMLANERRMIRQYINGEDIHMLRAMKMTGKVAADVSKEERKKAKPVSFGFLYGMGAPKFVTYAFDSYGVEFTEEESHEVRDGFFEDYPGLRPWHERQRRLARRYHRVSSPIGRVRHLPDILSTDKDVRAESERQAINSPVQSFASDLMLMALIRLHARSKVENLEKGKPTIYILGTVHDSILFEVKNGHEDYWVPIIKAEMEDMDYVRKAFGFDVTVPIIADLEIGTHWGETKEWQG